MGLVISEPSLFLTIVWMQSWVSSSLAGSLSSANICIQFHKSDLVSLHFSCSVLCSFYLNSTSIYDIPFFKKSAKKVIFFYFSHYIHFHMLFLTISTCFPSFFSFCQTVSPYVTFFRVKSFISVFTCPCYTLFWDRLLGKGWKITLQKSSEAWIQSHSAQFFSSSCFKSGGIHLV